MQNPTVFHTQALKRVLNEFYDADWGGDNFDRKSTSAYIIHIGSNSISWSCKKQSSVAQSSTEVEYKTIAFTTGELMWLQQLLFIYSGVL